MNWGVRIILGLGTFMLFIICATIYMVSSDTDTLVEDDYYEKSLRYDAVYDRKQNLLDDKAQPAIQIVNDTLLIRFKTERIAGSIDFKRPSDGSLDKTIPLYTSTNIFKLPLSTLKRGNWSLEINWESNNRKYMDTQSIFIK